MKRPQFSAWLADAVESGDSAEGCVIYALFDRGLDELDLDIRVRKGNLDGQGGYCIVNTMPQHDAISPKLSTSNRNIANEIAEHVTRRFPEIASNPLRDVWFTGSNIWSMLYGSADSDGKDWDIFTLDNLTALQLVTGMGWNLCPSFTTRDKRTGSRDPVVDESHIPTRSKIMDANGNAYSDGYCYVTPAGDIDVWVIGAETALDEIRAYPSKSHSHCRAAFSFHDGLIILPNESSHGCQP